MLLEPVITTEFKMSIGIEKLLLGARKRNEIWTPRGPLRNRVWLLPPLKIMERVQFTTVKEFKMFVFGVLSIERIHVFLHSAASAGLGWHACLRACLPPCSGGLEWPSCAVCGNKMFLGSCILAFCRIRRPRRVGRLPSAACTCALGSSLFRP